MGSLTDRLVALAEEREGGLGPHRLVLRDRGVLVEVLEAVGGWILLDEVDAVAKLSFGVAADLTRVSGDQVEWLLPPIAERVIQGVDSDIAEGFVKSLTAIRGVFFNFIRGLLVRFCRGSVEGLAASQAVDVALEFALFLFRDGVVYDGAVAAAHFLQRLLLVR